MTTLPAALNINTIKHNINNIRLERSFDVRKDAYIAPVHRRLHEPLSVGEYILLSRRRGEHRVEAVLSSFRLPPRPTNVSEVAQLRPERLFCEQRYLWGNIGDIRTRFRLNLLLE